MTFVARPAPTGHVSDHITSGLCDALVGAGLAPLDIPATDARFSATAKLVREGHTAPMTVTTPPAGRIVVPMMGKRFQLLHYAATIGSAVPFCWSIWEPDIDVWTRHFKYLSIKHAYATSSDACAAMNTQLGADVFQYAPEAVRGSDYLAGAPLADRPIHVLEMGRNYSLWHNTVASRLLAERRHHRYERRPGDLVFHTTQQMVTGLASTRISACFPLSTTHPERAGTFTTMTARYLETALSRAVIIGEPVEELTDLFGFDPVTPVDWTDPAGQVCAMLDSIDTYQPLVDLCHSRAVEVASWRPRLRRIAALGGW